MMVDAVPVTIAYTVGDRLALVESPMLAEGDQVIVEGNERLQPGMPVMLAPALNDAPAPAEGAQP